MNSALPKMLQPVSADARARRISGVRPIASIELAKTCIEPLWPEMSVQPARRIIDAANFGDLRSHDPAFDDFVAEQREHAIPDEERARVAVPVDARSAAAVVRIRVGARFQRAELGELERSVAKIE